jgi:hypothetical protein
MNSRQNIFIQMTIILFLFSLVQCTNDDDNQVVFSAVTVSGQIQNGNDLIEIDVTGDILDNPGSILTGANNIQGGNDVTFSGVGLSDNSSNINLRIIAYGCGTVAADESDNSNDRLRNAINDELEQGIIDIEIIIDQEQFSNVNLASNLIFENGCSILTQRDMQAISTQVVGEDELINELLVAPVNFSYTGFLYNMEETDSVFVEELIIVFPIVNF